MKKIVFSETRRKAMEKIQGKWLKFTLCLLFSMLVFLALIPDKYIYSFIAPNIELTIWDDFMLFLSSAIQSTLVFTFTASMYRIIFRRNENEKATIKLILKEANNVFPSSVVPILLTKVLLSFLSFLLTPQVINKFYDLLLLNVVDYPYFLIFTSVMEIIILIANIYVSLAFVLAPCIIADNPEINGIEALKISRRMMKKRKFNMFFFGIYFLPFFLLGSFVFGIGMLFVQSLFFTAIYVYYEELKECETIY